MKILHVAIGKAPSSGVIRQMEWEQRAAEDLNLQWDVVLFSEEASDSITSLIPKINPGLFAKVRSWVFRKWFYVKKIIFFSRTYDLILVRYDVMNIFLPLAPILSKAKIVSVHHTKEREEISGRKGTFSWLLAGIDQLARALFIYCSDAIIGVTPEIIDYEKRNPGMKNKPSFLYPNGLYLESLKPIDERREGVPKLLFVSSFFYPWHGLPSLLKSVSQSTSIFELNIVGEVPGETIERYSYDQRIIFHGKTHSEKITKISTTCDLGLASFNLHSRGMKQACTLKVREYLSQGLPVYSGYQDVFPDSMKFYKEGPPDIENIISHALYMRSHTKEAIRESAFNYIDKKVMVSSLYSNLENEFR